MRINQEFLKACKSMAQGSGDSHQSVCLTRTGKAGKEDKQSKQKEAQAALPGTTIEAARSLVAVATGAGLRVGGVVRMKLMDFKDENHNYFLPAERRIPLECPGATVLDVTESEATLLPFKPGCTFEKVKVPTVMFAKAYVPSMSKMARKLTGWSWCGDSEAGTAEANKRQVRC